MLRSEIIRAILEKRGISAEALEEYLNPSLAGLARPEELPGIVEAGDVLLDALASGLEMVVFGDYDCDGVCATTILSTALKALGGKVSEFVPARLTEGYGMSEKSVARMLRENPSVRLVITVDTGVNAVESIAELKAKGLQVVITDHHLPGDELPAADALVDPKVAAPEHLSDLCGAGVAFLLANRLISEARRRGRYKGSNIGGPLLVLAGLATVTDIMPLLGQNRILVAEALKHFGEWAPIGLKELHQRASRSGYDRLTSRDFGFMLGPRINAAGRLASSLEALELLSSDDREIVRELARIIDGYNTERKSIEPKMTDEAFSKVVAGASAQMIYLPNGHPGIAGIVAARLMEKLSTPVCVLAGGHGSARSPDGINIRDAFVACSSVLDKFGGHAAAGGFSVLDGKTDEFRRLLCAYCDKLAVTAARPSTGGGVGTVDACVDFSDITMELAEDIQKMEPFGEGNPEPVFAVRELTFGDVRQMGAEGKHLLITFRKSPLQAVWWGHGELVEQLRAESAVPHDIFFKVAISEYGERHVEMRLIGIERT